MLFKFQTLKGDLYMSTVHGRVDAPRLFITSDLHLGHKNIIQYCNRPFDFTEQVIEESDDFPVSSIQRYCKRE